MRSLLPKGPAGVTVAAKLGRETIQSKLAKPQGTNYFSTIDASLKKEAPELRNNLYTPPNNDVMGLKAWGQKKAMENGYVSDQFILSNLDGHKKDFAAKGIGLLTQLDRRSPGLGTKVAKTATESAARAVNVAKKVNDAFRETPEAIQLKQQFSFETGGKKIKKSTKKNRKKRKHGKTRRKK